MIKEGRRCDVCGTTIKVLEVKRKKFYLRWSEMPTTSG